MSAASHPAPFGRLDADFTQESLVSIVVLSLTLLPASHMGLVPISQSCAELRPIGWLAGRYRETHVQSQWWHHQFIADEVFAATYSRVLSCCL